MSVLNGNPEMATTSSLAQEGEPKEVEAGIWMQFIATPGKLFLAKLIIWHGVKNVRAPVFDVTTEAKVTLLMSCCKL